MTENQATELTFSEMLKTLTLEQLRDKEAFFIDEILRHYDELETVKVDKYFNGNDEDFLKENKFTAAIARDTAKLNAVRFAIGLKLQTDLLNTGNQIFGNLFKDGE